jgi:hypothetical protein
MNKTIKSINDEIMLRRYFQNLKDEDGAKDQVFLYAMNPDNHEFIWNCAKDFEKMFTHHIDEEAD